MRGSARRTGQREAAPVLCWRGRRRIGAPFPGVLAGATHTPSTTPLHHPQASDRIEAVATEHFWMSGMYWGLTAMALLGRLEEMDTAAVADWVLGCQKEGGGFGASPRNDAHLLYTLSAVQVRGEASSLELCH